MKKILFIGFLYAGAITMLVMSMHFFQQEASGLLKSKELVTEAWYRWTFKAHILFGIIAIFAGPVQFLEKLRARNLRLHRSIGYVYFISVLISSIAGLIIAQYAMGGIVSTLGFSALAIFWLSTDILAINAIKKKKIAEHQKWMLINYGLTFAAIPQRTMLALALIPGFKFIVVYQFSAWLPWILNTLIAFWIIKKTTPKIAR